MPSVKIGKSTSESNLKPPQPLRSILLFFVLVLQQLSQNSTITQVIDKIHPEKQSPLDGFVEQFGRTSWKVTSSGAIVGHEECITREERITDQVASSKKNGGTPKSSILIGFSIINHPFWGTPIFGNPQLVVKPPILKNMIIKLGASSPGAKINENM